MKLVRWCVSTPHARLAFELSLRELALSFGATSLCTKNYASGPDAALDSWVILKKATTVGE